MSSTAAVLAGRPIASQRLRRAVGACVAGALALAGSSFGAWLHFVHTPNVPMPRLAGETRIERIDASGAERSFIAHVPPDLRSGAPLVIVLHGYMMTAELMRRWSGYAFDRLAEEKGFVVAYPDGLRRSWKGCNPQMPLAPKDADDLSFIRALVATLQRDHGIDPRRVFVVGFSNGGQFALRLLAEDPAIAAGVAVAGTALPVHHGAACGPAGPPRPAMIVAGTSDPLVPFAGGEASLFGWEIGELLSADRTAARLAARNGLPGAPVETAFPQGPDGTSVTRKSWTAGGAPPVVLYVIHGGGHAMPQPVARFPRALGTTSKAFDMPATAIDFFGL